MANDNTPTKQSPGVTPGHYLLLQRIGQGSMGEIWLAEDPRLRRQVAIKTLPLRNQGDNEYLQRFEREARAAANLNHPHILPVHNFGEQRLPDGQSITYLVMPYIPGGSLSERIAWLMNNNQSMPQQEALQYLAQAADAIDYAHVQGVIHRDIKPANMLLRADNWLLLADFGIARILAEQDRLTQTGAGFGTPEYMAPEQAQGHAVAASDTYSLAVIAYQLFTGRVPFKADTPYATTIAAPDQSDALNGRRAGAAARAGQRSGTARSLSACLRQCTVTGCRQHATGCDLLQTDAGPYRRHSRYTHHTSAFRRSNGAAYHSAS